MKSRDSKKKQLQGKRSEHPQSPLREFWLPLIFIVGLISTSFSASVYQNTVLLGSLWAAAAVLLLWLVALAVVFSSTSIAPSFALTLRKQHYIQALVQLSLFAYWGYYWRPVYDHALLITAQLFFAYGFDMLLAWSRRRAYVLGFGPFPIIFSINLFLWFKDDWFYLQFIMIAVGMLGKEYVRWRRDGNSVHIFNPSAFSLGLFSLILLVTNTTHLTWGQEIASTLTLAPHIYLFLFCIGLVVMYFFSITLVAATAAAVLFGLSALYSLLHDVPYFLDSEIPAAVFLGLHLLITDPSTSPRSVLGKALFGALYGFGVFALYAMLSALGVPTFYDKLLCVPLLNLSVIIIDRFARRLHTLKPFQFADMPALPGAVNNALIACWIIFFAGMTWLGKTDGRHLGDQLPFWQQACVAGRSNACQRLVLLESTYCGDSSAWACNELGIQYVEGKIVDADEELANSFFSRGCELRYQAACYNLLDSTTLLHDNPHELDLRLLLREGGQNLMTMAKSDLYQRACAHGWAFACAGSVSLRR